MSRVEEVRQRMHQLYKEYLAAETELSTLEADSFRVCMFGSARIAPEDPIYQMVRELAKTLGCLGIDIVTGGGPGLMDAASEGVQEAHEKGIHSIGLPILLPNRQEVSNRHLDIKSEHTRFSSRLDEFMSLSHAVIVAPGGIGTLLELAYTWQLIQVHLIEPRAVVLLGSDFWNGLLDWMRAQQLRRGLVSAGDLGFVHVADTQAEVLALIKPELEKFRARKHEAGNQPREDEAATILEHVDRVRDAPEHQEAMPGVSR